MNKITVSKFIIRVAYFSFVILFVNANADAGVLFRNRQQVIRTYQPGFRQLQYNVRTSTAVMRSTQPRNITQGKDFGGVSDQMKLVKARYKYETNLAKWEDKREKQQKALDKKKKDIAAKQAKLRARQLERLRKEQQADQSRVQLTSSFPFGNNSSAISSNSNSRGSLLAPSNNASNAGAKKKGFWSSLIQAIFGKKPENP